MKRVILFALAILPLLSQLKAQNCEALVAPHFNYNINLMERAPQEKLNYLCHYAQSAFFETDKLPEGALVFNFSDLTATLDGRHPSADYVFDATTLSYYAYNFIDFQVQDLNNTIYFRTPSSRHAYLGVRSVQEMREICMPYENVQEAK